MENSEVVDITSQDLFGDRASHDYQVDFFNYHTQTVLPTGQRLERPTDGQKDANHLSYMLWDMQQKQFNLEMRKMEAKKQRKDTRAKYGW